jgi:hypothetical protein
VADAHGSRQTAGTSDEPSEHTPPVRLPRWVFPAGLVASMAVGLLFVVMTPPGAPYDEPSHFQTVQYYAAHWNLPEIGAPGTTYEASQPPAFYVLAGGVYRAGTAVGLGEHGAFYGLRALTLTLLVPFAFVTRRIARLWLPENHLVADVGGIVAAGSPAILSIGDRKSVV